MTLPDVGVRRRLQLALGKSPGRRESGSLVAGGLGLCIGIAYFLATLALLLFVLRTGLEVSRQEADRSVSELAVALASQVDMLAHEALSARSQTGSSAYMQALAPLERMHLALPNVRNVYTKRLRPDGSMVYVLDTANSRHATLRDRATSVMRVGDPVAPGEFDPRMVEAVRRGQTWFDSRRFVESGVKLRGIYAPLRDQSGLIVGMIGMDYTEDVVAERIAGWANGIQGGTLSALAALATLLGVACQLLISRLGEVTRRRREDSLRDALTGVFNRRHFDAMMVAHAGASRSLARPLALLLLDADHFKQINDEHGHPGGDAVLSEIGRAIAGSVRSGDIPCRIGGEEFGLILPETSAAEAERVYARIAGRLSAPVVFRDREIPVGLSAGVAVFEPDREDVSRFFARADRALYCAKAEGRARCSLAPAPGSGS